MQGKNALEPSANAVAVPHCGESPVCTSAGKNTQDIVLQEAQLH